MQLDLISLIISPFLGREDVHSIGFGVFGAFSSIAPYDVRILDPHDSACSEARSKERSGIIPRRQQGDAARREASRTRMRNDAHAAV